MRMTRLAWLAGVLCVGLTGSAHAQYYAPATHAPLLPAPDACNYGPPYCVRPPFPPVNGVAPPPWSAMGQGSCGHGCCGHGCCGHDRIPPIAAFPTHPYARGPRDYFMWSDAQRERLTRERRPPLIP